MNHKKFIYALMLICATTCASARDIPPMPDKHHDNQFEIIVMMGAPTPMLMMGMSNMPPAPRPPHMRHDPMMDRHAFEHKIKLTDKQREKFHNLNKKHRRDIDDMNNARMAMQERYQEKFEAVLTDEQFRKIENMRKDLRKDLKKLDDKQQKLFEEHRRDFESILTDEQRKELQKMRDGQNPSPDKDDK